MFASVNTSVPVPTAVRVTCAGSNGTALNAGPCVTYQVPEYVLPTPRVAVIDSHHALPDVSYVNQVTKRTSPCCAMLRPHPDSELAGAFHHMPSYCAGATGNPLLAASTDAYVSSMPLPHVL